MDVEMKETDGEQSQVDEQPKKDDTPPKTSTTAYELPWYSLWLFVSALSWHLYQLHVVKDSEPGATDKLTFFRTFTFIVINNYDLNVLLCTGLKNTDP